MVTIQPFYIWLCARCVIPDLHVLFSCAFRGKKAREQLSLVLRTQKRLHRVPAFHPVDVSANADCKTLLPALFCKSILKNWSHKAVLFAICWACDCFRACRFFLFGCRCWLKSQGVRMSECFFVSGTVLKSMSGIVATTLNSQKDTLKPLLLLLLLFDKFISSYSQQSHMPTNYVYCVQSLWL